MSNERRCYHEGVLSRAGTHARGTRGVRVQVLSRAFSLGSARHCYMYCACLVVLARLGPSRGAGLAGPATPGGARAAPLRVAGSEAFTIVLAPHPGPPHVS